MTGERDDAQVVSDTGAFAIVPEWLIDEAVSDRAIRMYAILARYADKHGEGVFPFRATLGRRLKCSLDSVDRAKGELRRIGALSWKRRVDDAGDLTSSLYTVHRARGGRTGAATSPQECGDGGRTDAATGGRTGAAYNENHLEREPMNETPPSTPGGADIVPIEVDGKGLRGVAFARVDGDNDTTAIVETDQTADVHAHWATVVELCGALADHVANLHPGAKRPTVIRSWLIDMDRLLRIDARTPQQVAAAIAWVHDDDFWRSNIMSPGTLRKQYDRLVQASIREKKQRGPRMRTVDLGGPVAAAPVG